MLGVALSDSMHHDDRPHSAFTDEGKVEVVKRLRFEIDEVFV